MAGTARRRGTIPNSWAAVLLVATLVAVAVAVFATRGHKTREGCHYYGRVERCTTPTTTAPDPFDTGIPTDGTDV